MSKEPSTPTGPSPTRNDARRATPSLAAFFSAVATASGRDVDPDAGRQGQLGQQGNEEASGAGAKIEEPQRALPPALVIDDSQYGLHQGLGIRPGVERRARKHKAAAAELALTGNAGQGLASEAARRTVSMRSNSASLTGRRGSVTKTSGVRAVAMSTSSRASCSGQSIPPARKAPATERTA